ncbi:Uncharacterized protein FWK35_00009915 [Aphis craccivora]|uniref:Ig-like domain-containing protein n=1 Tax=Aphis craccivora TaxID=307492 RepID=A0A6G0ZFQ8_APHCR|nr:Uncharacterized protein FWK35_00009915 [Aphis craccivora]
MVLLLREQQSDINARIGQSAFLPCELEPNNVTMGFEITTQCGIVHSVKWYRGANRIFLYSGGPRTTQPHREGYTDSRYTPIPIISLRSVIL